jgi:hypothetical protein
MFLKIGVKKLGFESRKGFDFLNSENAMRRAAVQRCALQDIFQSHINIRLH